MATTLEDDVRAIIGGDESREARQTKPDPKRLNRVETANAIYAHRVPREQYREFCQSHGIKKRVHFWTTAHLLEFCEKFGIVPVYFARGEAPWEREGGLGSAQAGESRDQEGEAVKTKEQPKNDGSEAAQLASLIQKLASGAIDADRVREIVHEEISEAQSHGDLVSEDAVAEVADRLIEERVAGAVETLTKLLNETKKVETTIQVGARPKVDLGKEPVHEKLSEVLMHLELGNHVLLIGPAGCGKSYLARQAAKVMSARKFGKLSCTAGSSEGHLLGRLLPTGDAGKFEYTVSDFVDCYENGGGFLLDEVDALDPNMALVLNDALANGHMSVPTRITNPVATRHSDFWLIAAANTYGTGADRLYVGRNQLDEAFLDRFRMAQIEMEYDANLEKQLCPNVELRQRFVAIRNAAQSSGLRRVVSTRAMEQAYKVVAQGGQSIEYAVEQLVKGWTKDERSKVGLPATPSKQAGFKLAKEGK